MKASTIIILVFLLFFIFQNNDLRKENLKLKKENLELQKENINLQKQFDSLEIILLKTQKQFRNHLNTCAFISKDQIIAQTEWQIIANTTERLTFNNMN